jgi:lipid-binding SYLF domain-containing protein
MHMLKTLVASTAVLLLASSAFAQLSKSDVKKLNEATTTLSEIRGAPDSGIPESIWNKAECVVVIPDLKKASFIVGGEHGSGVMSCRHANAWGPPVFMEMTKGSAGFQIGVQSTDLVLVVMNKEGVDKLLNNKVTLGADASIAAGPVGRTASAATDAQLSAEMLAYSRSKGLFAGINLSGGTLNPDNSKNERAYGPNANARDIALGVKPVKVGAEARAFSEALGRHIEATSGKTPGTTKNKK